MNVLVAGLLFNFILNNYTCRNGFDNTVLYYDNWNKKKSEYDKSVSWTNKLGPTHSGAKASMDH